MRVAIHPGEDPDFDFGLVDHLAWGYEYCPLPAVEWICEDGLPKPGGPKGATDGSSYIYPQDPAVTVTDIVVGFNTAIASIANVCIASTSGSPEATSHSLIVPS